MIAASKGKVIAANKFGKAKTFLQMASTGIVFLVLSVVEITKLPIHEEAFRMAAMVMFWIACAVSVLSGIKYTKDGWFMIETK